MFTIGQMVARKSDGLAGAVIRTADYRKTDGTMVEEVTIALAMGGEWTGFHTGIVALTYA